MHGACPDLTCTRLTGKTIWKTLATPSGRHTFHWEAPSRKTKASTMPVFLHYQTLKRLNLANQDKWLEDP
eukprot:1144853-Pelagomonas_calceolata.AAC.5